MGTKASFFVKYEGPALDNNSMDVKELAPALISIADLLEESNKVINGSKSNIQVNVRGSFKSGSFGIDFNIIQSFLENMAVLFASDPFSAAANLLALIGFIDSNKAGLIKLLKSLGGRGIQEIIKRDEDRITIKITNTEEIDIDPRVLDLYKNERIRNALAGAIAIPLEKEGVEKVTTGSIEHTKSPLVEVFKDEKQFFDPPDIEDEVLTENETVCYLQIVNIAFKRDNKWRFSRGETMFYANIEDNEFLQRVWQNAETFAKDDIFKVVLNTKDILGENGLRTEYVIKEVLEHRSAARQLQLPFTKDE